MGGKKEKIFLNILETEPTSQTSSVRTAKDNDERLNSGREVERDDLLEKVGDVAEGLLGGEEPEVLSGEGGEGIAEAVEAVLHRELQGAVELGVAAHGEVLDVGAGDRPLAADLQEDGAGGLVPDGGVDKVALLVQPGVLVVEVVHLVHEPQLRRVAQ